MCTSRRLLVFERRYCRSFFFFNDTATTEIYTLSLHDALPISRALEVVPSDVLAKQLAALARNSRTSGRATSSVSRVRSEEHTSELQSPCNLVCRLLLEKKKKRPVQVPASHAAQHP